MSYFKGWSVSDVLAFSAASRAKTGFSFIERCLDEYPNGTLRDESVSSPYSRQIDILISYNFELILDAGVFMSSSKSSEHEILNEVKGLHTLDRKWQKVTVPEIKSLLGINDVVEQKNGVFKYYSVTLGSGEILSVEDLIDIRYDIRDFREKEPQYLRLTAMKDSSFDKITQTSKNIAGKIMKYIEEKYSKRPTNS
ncbi:MAG: hypothetical protein UT84_C0012G0017 [Candidatus Curtissbacteria bacterium GW2011_GWA1_40_16]|uniref:Uncharacterized protein n=1 Tax=Candidatus Curtissbacteria bacterium GW2011_GWA1_40_16 TaxID=1618405 RepID=A0A0G0RC67_9BACT|nr:MAG: hypothetical protein UT84_C0012G0017 [Candidatus Curtissbacteria bacterium GW2011_GWA1_40_16]